MSECAPEAPAGKEEKKADSKDAHAGKADAKDAHGKDDKKGDKKGDKKDAHGPADAHAVHWDYEGAMGPENWGKEFPTCGKGKSQAPLNIKGPFEKVRFSIAPDYKQGQLKMHWLRLAKK